MREEREVDGGGARLVGREGRDERGCKYYVCNLHTRGAPFFLLLLFTLELKQGAREREREGKIERKRRVEVECKLSFSLFYLQPTTGGVGCKMF